MPKLIMLVGLPGSGKSTYVKKTFDFKTGEYLYLSTDVFIEINASLNKITYNEAFPLYIKNAETFLNDSLQLAIDDNISMVWDQTNL